MSGTRNLVKRMIEDRLDPLDDFELPAVVGELVEVIKADKVLFDAYVDETLHAMVYDEAMTLLNRHRIRTMRLAEVDGALAAQPSAPSTLRTLLARGRGDQKARLRWLRHTEHIGDRHVKLMAMRKEQIPLALALRGARRDTEDLYMRFLQTIHDGMADGQQVADVYSAEALEVLFEGVRAGRPTEPEPIAIPIQA